MLHPTDYAPESRINSNNKNYSQGTLNKMQYFKLLLLPVMAILLLSASSINAQSFTNTSPTCGPNFPSSCKCGRELYESRVQYIVNCTNAGLRNTSVLEFMPDEVEILIFTGNQIPELPWNVFGSINDYNKLKIVDMSNNHIREIRGKSYHHVSNVERLILNHNNLSISRFEDEVNHHHPRVFSNFLNLQSLHLTNAFEDNSSPQLSEDLHDIFVNSQLEKLQKLHLEQNEITHFKDRTVFCELPQLRDLYLGDNLLKDINFDVRCLKNLRFLDLERNKFEFVKPTDLLLLNELEERPNRTVNLIVDFGLNPFVCNCKISPLRTWLESTKVTVRNKNELMCYNEIMGSTAHATTTSASHIMQLDMMTGECAAAVAAAATFFNTDAGEERYGNLQQQQQQQQQVQHVREVSGHTATLIFMLIVLSMILLGLIVALLYITRDRLKYMITPVFDNVAKKVQYTSIRDEDCPEVHV